MTVKVRLAFACVYYHGRHMQNPYSPPQSPLDLTSVGENNSGGGRDTTPPIGVSGWSWGAFLLSWVWAVFNKTWFGLLSLIPYVGILVALYLGVKGRELAWRNKRWESLEYFNQVQRRWSFWGVIIVVGTAAMGFIAGIAVPAYQQYVHRHGGG
jgi:hypothetical protein